MSDDEFLHSDRTSGRAAAVDLPEDSHLGYVYGIDDPKVARYRGMTYEQFSRDRVSAPFVQDLLAYWNGLYEEPFVGITTDGVVRRGLYPLRAADFDPAPVDAALSLLGLLTPAQRDRFTYPVDAPEWRAWSNPEFVVHRVGLRLEDLAPDVADAVLDMVRASLSPEGWDLVSGAMSLNGYLGELVGLPTVMNDRSYQVSLFGTPSREGPWGWQLFGHHVAVNFLSTGGRHVIAPVFIGGEPAVADGWPPLFADREARALELAASLTDAQRTEAVVYGSVLDPAMPAERLHPADERHLAGAFRDNRVIPYEGIRATSLTDGQRALLRRVTEDFHLLLRQPQRDATMADYDAHVDDTWFCWYGATDGSQPFYFRIQSPVVLAELDHHAGVWLTNRLPARFHVHTILRLPNGNDYGRAYLEQDVDV
jgi:hypothetical protein